MTKRLTPLRPLTPDELSVVELLDLRVPFHIIAERMQRKRDAVVWLARSAASKIPGSLPMSTKLVLWFRGGSRKALGCG